MENQNIKDATLKLLQELKQEIEKADYKRISFSRVHELLAVVYEPVRFLASREKSVRSKR